MSEHKHTPGPWSIGTIGKIKSGGFEAWIDGQNHGCIAQVVVAMEGEGENENPTLMGNARLIAAAPELLEALEKAREDINWMLNSGQPLNGHVFDYIDEAIAKATGGKE